jgi:energy-coupling factor transporter ATP-binding protein EcfA2
MHIQRARVRDIGPFEDLALDLPAGVRPDRADVHLLIGPNGTGKTTLLEAIAQVFTQRPLPHFARRVRSADAVVQVRYDGGSIVWSPRAGNPSIVVDGETLGPVHLDASGHYGSGRGVLFHLQGVSGPELEAQRHVFSDEDAIVFAYGTGRGLPRDPTAPSSPSDNPLADAAQFDKPVAATFTSWLGRILAQRAVALQHGAPEVDARLVGTLDRIQRAIGKVVGGEVVFELDPNLRTHVRWDDRLVPLDQLPAGLSGLLTWVGDLLMRLERMPWRDDTPVDRRSFVLLLDEVEVHLHPAWQRRVLPMVEELFPRAQIIAATHSPFVIQSASDAFIHRLEVTGGTVRAETVRGPLGESYPAVVRELMGLTTEFSVEVEARWFELRRLKDDVLAGRRPRVEFDVAATRLAELGEEVHHLVAVEVRQLERQLASQVAHP